LVDDLVDASVDDLIVSGQSEADNSIAKPLKELRNFQPKMTGQNGHILGLFLSVTSPVIREE
jgi:hypothetical protein